MIDLWQIAVKSGASQDAFELFQMLKVVEYLNTKKILEVGVHTGLGLKAFGDAFPKAKLFGVECDDRSLVFKEFELIKGDSTSQEIIDKVKAYGPFDFIFIDGDHTFEGVKADWENYKDMVRPGGAVGFHDTSRVGEGWMSKVEVRPFLDDLLQHSSMPMVEFRNGWENPGTIIVWPKS